MLEFGKEVFDAVAFFVEVCIERPVKAVVFAAGNDGDCAGSVNGSNGILSIITLVGNDVTRGHLFQQGFGLSNVVAIAAG